MAAELEESIQFSGHRTFDNMRMRSGATLLERRGRASEIRKRREEIMGFLEEAAGAFAAVEGAKKLDPNAGVVTEGVAALAGFEGTKAVGEFIEKKEEGSQDQQPASDNQG
jgi:hypothetical protein